MPVFLVGLSHHTAPVEIREQFALADCGLRMALADLPLSPLSASLGDQAEPAAPLQEAVILSTCNRLEFYGVAPDAAAGRCCVEHYLADLQGIPLAQLRPHLYFSAGERAVSHLLRVAAGLDSAVLGEPQILGQVSLARGEALAAGTAGPVLARLFAHAAHAGKRSRSHTPISRHTTSVGHTAALLARQHFPELSEAQVLLVGAGEMAELAARALLHLGVHQFTCINRTHSRAETLAAQIQGRALNWYHLDQALQWADIVICATGAPHTVLHVDEISPLLEKRAERPLLVIDMAVPRDVEPAVAALPGVRVFDIDHLRSSLDANLAQRQAAIPSVETILADEAAHFHDWLNSRRVVDTIVELRARVQAIADDEVDEALRRLSSADPRSAEVVNRLVHRLVNKLLHNPTVRLKEQARAGNGVAHAQLLRYLFALEEPLDPDQEGTQQAVPAAAAHHPSPTLVTDRQPSCVGIPAHE